MSSSWEIGYKIVAVEEGRSYSFSLPRGIRQEYWVGRATKQRRGKWGYLTAFSNLFPAEVFFDEQFLGRVNAKVFECRYKPVLVELTHRLGAPLMSLPKIPVVYMPVKAWPKKRFLRSSQVVVQGDIFVRKVVPEGTVFATEIELISEV